MSGVADWGNSWTVRDRARWHREDGSTQREVGYSETLGTFQMLTIDSDCPRFNESETHFRSQYGGKS